MLALAVRIFAKCESIPENKFEVFRTIYERKLSIKYFDKYSLEFENAKEYLKMRKKIRMLS